jgi:hypothetical protein
MFWPILAILLLFLPSLAQASSRVGLRLMHAFGIGSVVPTMHDEIRKICPETFLGVLGVANLDFRSQFKTEFGSMALLGEIVAILHPSPDQDVGFIKRLENIYNIKGRPFYFSEGTRPKEYFASSRIIGSERERVNISGGDIVSLNMYDQLLSQSISVVLKQRDYSPCVGNVAVYDPGLNLQWLQINKRSVLRDKYFGLFSVSSPLQAPHTNLHKSNDCQDNGERRDDTVGVVPGPPLFRRGIIAFVCRGACTPVWAWGITQRGGRRYIGIAAMFAADACAIISVALVLLTMFPASWGWAI